jgi:histidinol-phosphate aminotransferase
MCRYGAFPYEIIKYLWRAKQPYNVSVASETAALAALGNRDYMDMIRDKLVRERDTLFSLLEQVPFLQPYPSQGNFILCKVCARVRCNVMSGYTSSRNLCIHIKFIAGQWS